MIREMIQEIEDTKLPQYQDCQLEPPDSNSSSLQV
jgi:hypothetical protein